MLRTILKELKHHAPFTVAGAASGVLIMILFRGLSPGVSHTVFYVLHPVHVVLSALVTASMYQLHRCGKERCRSQLWLLLIIGYVGSVGIATLSDSVIPYVGEVLLGMPNRGLHLGFIERWWLVNPLALLGVAIAYFRPSTRFPHAGHVLLSTWASLFHIIMARGEAFHWSMYLVVFLFLFLAVWIPCCVSDIVFPLLLVRKQQRDRVQA
jgi:hypothetical protein